MEMFIELMSEISTGRHSVVRSWNSLKSAKSSALRTTDLFQVASQAGKQGDGNDGERRREGWGIEGEHVYMIQRQSDSFARSLRTFVHTLISTSSWCLQPVPPASSARQRAEEAGWRTTRKATILSRERRSLDSRVPRLQRRGSRANARDVLRPSYVRKLKS